MQFLDGLLKIPFEIYKEEPVLTLMRDNIKLFSGLIKRLAKEDVILNQIALPFQIKERYTSLEIQKYMPLLKGGSIQKCLLQHVKAIIATCSKPKMIELYGKLKNSTDIAIQSTGTTIKQLRDDFM